ncbi:MAG: M48 family peptidase, partial [Verrucomicrobiota bacterium]
MEVNIYFISILGFLLASKLLDTWAESLTLQRLNNEIPDEFDGVIDPETYANLKEYTRVNTRFGWLSRWFGIGVLLAFWFLGGFS